MCQVGSKTVLTEEKKEMKGEEKIRVQDKERFEEQKGLNRGQRPKQEQTATGSPYKQTGEQSLFGLW